MSCHPPSPSPWASRWPPTDRPQAAPAMAAGAGDPAQPPEPGLHGPVLIVFDGDGAVEDVVEASGVAEAIAAIEHKAAAPAGPLLVLLVPVAAGEWEATCARATPRARQRRGRLRRRSWSTRMAR